MRKSSSYPQAIVTDGLGGPPDIGSGSALAGNGPFAVHITGSVTETYEWKPDTGFSIETDPPPNKILLHEKTSLSYSVNGDPGSCSGSATTGMTNETGAEDDRSDGGSPRGSGFATGARNGEMWKVMPGGPAVSVVSPIFNVSGQGSSTSGTSLSSHADVKVSFTADIGNIYINFTCSNNDTNAVLGKLGAQRCLVGMGITANVTITPDAPPTYSPPSDTVPFKAYDITKTNDDQLTALDGTFASIPHFFNAKAGAAAVTCSGMVNGEAFTVTEKLTVEPPENLMWNVKGGTSRLLDSQEQYGLFHTLNDDPPMTNGINWEAEMSLPTGFNGASITFTQKITMTRDDFYKSSQPTPHKINKYHDKTGLDIGFDFFGIFPCSLGKSGDTPQQGCNNTMSSSVSSDSFDTWLMFKPSVSDAAWVPLRTCHWSWGGTATWNNGASRFDFTGTSPPASPPTTDTSTHPQWNLIVPSPQSMVPAPNP